MGSPITYTHVCISFECATPFNLMFGRETHLPIDLPAEKCLTDKSADQLRDSLNHAYSRVCTHMETAHNRKKTNYDQHARKHSYHLNEEVWLHNPVVPRGSNRKFHRPWQEPFRIVERLSEVLYKIQRVNNPKRQCTVDSNLSIDVPNQEELHPPYYTYQYTLQKAQLSQICQIQAVMIVTQTLLLNTLKLGHHLLLLTMQIQIFLSPGHVCYIVLQGKDVHQTGMELLSLWKVQILNPMTRRG